MSAPPTHQYIYIMYAPLTHQYIYNVCAPNTPYTSSLSLHTSSPHFYTLPSLCHVHTLPHALHMQALMYASSINITYVIASFIIRNVFIIIHSIITSHIIIYKDHMPSLSWYYSHSHFTYNIIYIHIITIHSSIHLSHQIMNTLSNAMLFSKPISKPSFIHKHAIIHFHTSYTFMQLTLQQSSKKTTYFT